MELYPIECYKALAMAVVDTAAKDYMRSLRGISRNTEKLKSLLPNDEDYATTVAKIQSAKAIKYSCEKFFRSERFDIFMNGIIDGEEFIKKLTRKALDPFYVIKEDEEYAD